MPSQRRKDALKTYCSRSRFACGFWFPLLLLSLFAACDKTDGDDAGSGAAGGMRAGAAGNGATAGSSGTVGTSGSAGSSAGKGGTSGTAGAPNTSGSSGSAGAPPNRGGSAGEPPAAGTSGAAGNDGTGGESRITGEGGTAGEGGAPNEPRGLSWPIDCIPDQTCLDLGYPDTDSDGDAHDCSQPGYAGHEGTDIGISAEAQAAGTSVFAAADGVVVFAFDGKYDQCPNASEPDCQDPEITDPGSTDGTTVCTPLGPYCGTGEPGCYWCFAGGNVVVIRHEDVPGVFATRYDHLKKNSILVEPGSSVTRGQKIAEAASAGKSTAPHLHFEVWGTGFYELADPWAGACGPNTGPSLWAYDPPWSG